jgi:HSP20 family protein|tara:strand:- start:307 stop:765 length:459 start_codon:yes stop_codon:yes gene_type:complete
MSSSNIDPIIQNGIALLESNLNTSFSGQLSEILREQGINLPGIWNPSVDIINTESKLYVYANIPGVDSNTIDVDFYNNMINIKGERLIPEIAEEIINRKQEIIYGKFERKIIIPMSVTNRESVKILFEVGVLKIIVDKNLESSNSFTLRIEN